jgi:hypothetical protein
MNRTAGRISRLGLIVLAGVARLAIAAPSQDAAGGGEAPATVVAPGSRLVIVKADDFRAPNANWDRFVKIAREKGIKVSIGIICQSLQEDTRGCYQWLRDQQKDGEVEFWNHGWDHAHWTLPDGKPASEFSGSGYAHQKEDLGKAQAKARAVLGVPLNAIGTPGNGMDLETIRVLNESPEVRGVFCFPRRALLAGLRGKVLLPMNLIGENDGVAKPNFEKFKQIYDGQKSRLAFTALQFHPPYFSDRAFGEFSAIVDLLKADGWTFILPNDYIRLREKVVQTSPN